MENIYFRLDENGDVVTNVEHKKVVHSPTGFSWGYHGSGCAEFALNILLRFIDESNAIALHQRFKFDFIAKFPEEGGEISYGEIIQWLREHDIKVNIENEGG